MDLTAVVDWLLHGNNFLVVAGGFIALLALCYGTTIFSRKSLALGKITHCVLMGLIGGFVFGLTSLLFLPPLLLVLHIYLAKPLAPHTSFWQSLLFALPHMISPTFWSILVQITISGVIIGMFVGIVNVLLELLLPAPRPRPLAPNSAMQAPTFKQYSRETATAWLIFCIAFSMGFSIIFSNNGLGIGIGFGVAACAFLLGLHPKPTFTRQLWLKAVRSIGFWLLCGTVALLAIVKGIIYPVLKNFALGLFILIVLLLFFALLFWLMKNVKFQKPVTANINDASRLRLAINRVQVKRTLLVGITSGFLIIGCIFGLPLGYVCWQYFGPGAALLIFLAFALFGIGYGIAWGILLCYSYNFSLFVAWKVTNLSDRQLQTIGLILGIFGIVLAIIPSLSW